jgi:D-alanine-D-alanine ligase-like ATP-grasp enzyme
VDVRLDENNNAYVLEVNNLCSVSAGSYFGLSLEANGYSRVQLFSQQLKQAQARVLNAAQVS